jgi:excisionase family DNA binding protein
VTAIDKAQTHIREALALIAAVQADTPEPPRTLAVTLESAARMLDMDKATIRRMVAAGELQAAGEGKRLRVSVASLEAWAAGKKR